MSLIHYRARNINSPLNPNEEYRELQQALIDDLWDNTTTIQTIAQEVELGTFLFEDVEVRLNHAVEKSTGIKQGDDFREVIFRDLEYNSPKGLYYYFNDNYWITINLDQYDRTSKNIFVRRCNNTIRVVDNIDGSIVKLPCVIDYDVGAPAPQVDNNIITPNGHPIIIVQGNNMSRRLLKQNTRIIFGSRVFKITGTNDIMMDNAFDNNSSLLYLDAFQDEIHPQDDFENGLAFNSSTNYSLELPYTHIAQLQGYSTTITPIVKLDGTVVGRFTKIETLDTNVVEISGNTITLVGNVGDTATINIQLGENTNIQKQITVEIVEQLEQQIDFKIHPIITSVRQGQAVQFSVSVIKDNVEQDDVVHIIPQLTSEYFNLKRVHDNTFELKCLVPSSKPLILTLTNGVIEKDIEVKLKSMF